MIFPNFLSYKDRFSRPVEELASIFRQLDLDLNARIYRSDPSSLARLRG